MRDYLCDKCGEVVPELEKQVEASYGADTFRFCSISCLAKWAGGNVHKHVIRKCKRCGCSSHLNEDKHGRCYVHCDNGSNCWDGPAEPTKKEAVESWNKLMGDS